MAEGVTFQLNGHALPCPDLAKGNHELGGLEYVYLDGSPCYIGSPSITYFWPRLDPADVTTIRATYNALVEGYDPGSGGPGTPISCTIPDYKGVGGWRTTTAYMAEPAGTAVGDGAVDFSVTLYNLHEASMQAAMNNPQGNLWDTATNGGNLTIGTAQYSGSGWQF